MSTACADAPSPETIHPEADRPESAQPRPARPGSAHSEPRQPGPAQPAASVEEPPSTQKGPASPPVPTKPGLRSALNSLRVRNYRLYVISQLLTNPCGWMQRVAQDWLILTLTGSVTMVGLTVTLQLGPMLLFGLWGGVIADRYDKRTILMVTQSLFAASAFTLGVLTLTGLVRPWHILVSAAFLGLATVVDNPSRQAFVPEVAGPEHLRNAISINSTVFQLGGLLGPALAGASIAAVGEGWSFLLNGLAGVTAVTLLVAMRPDQLRRTPVAPRAPGQLREGLAYVRRTPEILWAVVLVGFVAVSGINLATVLAAYADEVFDIGASGYGLLNSCVAAGAVLGALASTRRTRLRLRQLVYGAAVLGLLEVGASALGALWLFAPVLIAIGAASLLYLTAGNTMVQTTVTPRMRGRVMALYVLVLFGAQAASGTIIGTVAGAYGARVAMMVCGLGPLLGAAVVGVVLARRGGLVPRVILHDRPGRGVVYVVPATAPTARTRSRRRALGGRADCTRRRSVGALVRDVTSRGSRRRRPAGRGDGRRRPGPPGPMAGAATR